MDTEFFRPAVLDEGNLALNLRELADRRVAIGTVFTNLDDDNAALVWRQLERVATERQVIVATQEAGLLERLGIAPDIRL